MFRVNNLVGFGAKRGVVIAFQGSETSSAETVAWPSVAAGDLVVLADYAINSIGTPSSVTPTDFSLAAEVSDSLTRAMVTYKVCDGTETGNITGMNGSSAERKILLHFTGGVAAANNPLTWDTEVTPNNPTLQTVSASGRNTPLIVFGVAISSGFVAGFTTEDPAFDDVVVADFSFGYKTYNSAPADHDIDMADNGTRNILLSGLLELS